MISGVKPYPAMKDSGVPWIGDIPTHWNLRRLRHVATIRFSNVDKHSKEGECAVRLCNYTDVYHNDRIRSDMDLMQATATAEEIERFRLAVGDVLITKDSESWDDIGVPALVEDADPDIICGYHLALLRPNAGGVNGQFLHRALSCQGVSCQFYVRANGVTRFGLSQTAIKSVLLPIAPLAEQAAIARFLDNATCRIDACLRAQEKLVLALKEHKQAIINRAVTGQVDVRTGQPYRAYKQSGIEWPARVPSHWNVKKLCHAGTIVGGMTPAMDDGRFWNGDVPWVTPKDMKRDDIANSSVKVSRTALADTSLKLVTSPAVLLVVRGMILARRVPVAWTKRDVTINQDMKAISPAMGLKAEFLARMLGSAQESLLGMTDEAGHGTRRLPTERWTNLAVAIPPECEQALILDSLKHSIDATDALIGGIRRERSLLEGYRDRLIADVVTGKFDVRGMRLESSDAGSAIEFQSRSASALR